MELLPPDVLAITFRFTILQPRPVPFRTLTLVNRRFHEAVWRFFISTRNIRLTDKGEEAINDTFTCLKHVTSLEISSCLPRVLMHIAHVAPKLSTLRILRGGLSEEGVAILSGMPSLRHLRLEFYPNPAWRSESGKSGCISELKHLESLETVITSDPWMRELAALRGLFVRGSGSLTSNGLMAMGNHLRLRDVVLSDCHSLTDEGIESIVRASQETLEFLDVSFCDKLTDRSLLALGGCVNLQGVRASFCKGLNGSGIEGLHSCTRLSKLDLSHTGHADPAALHFASRLYSLTSLDLSRVRGMTLEGLNAIAEALHSLQRMIVFLDASFTEETLCNLSFPHHVQYLSLGASQIAFVPPRIAYLSQLRVLNLEANRRLTSRGLAPVAQCKSLTHLHLQGCEQLANPALNYLENLTTLRVLDLRFCPNLSAHRISKLPRHLIVHCRYSIDERFRESDRFGRSMQPGDHTRLVPSPPRERARAPFGGPVAPRNAVAAVAAVPVPPPPVPPPTAPVSATLLGSLLEEDEDEEVRPSALDDIMDELAENLDDDELSKREYY